MVYDWGLSCWQVVSFKYTFVYWGLILQLGVQLEVVIYHENTPLFALRYCCFTPYPFIGLDGHRRNSTTSTGCHRKLKNFLKPIINSINVFYVKFRSILHFATGFNYRYLVTSNLWQVQQLPKKTQWRNSHSFWSPWEYIRTTNLKLLRPHNNRIVLLLY